MSFTPEQAWQSVLGQLQMEMPKASFDTWVRDTQVVGCEDDVLQIGVRNAYARDWLESRLASTVNRLLIGILNKQVNVEFVVDQNSEQEQQEESDEQESPTREEEAEVQIINRLRYDEIVIPSKVVAIPGYFSRLIPEIGARSAWLYIGWRQAFWSKVRGNGDRAQTRRVAMKHIIRYSGLSRRTFFRALEDESTWDSLSGLVERDDTSPHWAQGKDRRSHRLANRYTVHMTLPLSRSDSKGVHEWLSDQMQAGSSLLDALRQALQIKDLVGELLSPLGVNCTEGKPQTYIQTVMDMAKSFLGPNDGLTPELLDAAEALHRKIISGFGTILLTHYFLETVIPRSGLTPPQAWLVALLRDRCYLNQQTGERRDEVLVRGGYVELASWLGLSRPKTIWEWMRDSKGTVQGFIALLPRQERDEIDALRLKVRLDEPLFDGVPDTIELARMAPEDGEDDTIKRGASGTIGVAQMTPMDGEDDTKDWREWHPINHLNTALSSSEKNTTTTRTTAAVLPTAWVLRKLLIQNHVHPKVTKALLISNASAVAFVSWVLFACSPAGEGIGDPVAYAIASLREDSQQGAGGSFDRLSRMEPASLIRYLDNAPKDLLFARTQGTHLTEWDAAMGFYNRKLPALRKILLGE